MAYGELRIGYRERGMLYW